MSTNPPEHDVHSYLVPESSRRVRCTANTQSCLLYKPKNTEYRKYRNLLGSIIVIEGIIGVGKTTLGNSLAEYLNSLDIKAKFFPEYRNGQLLEQYITDMKKYAYAFQLFMLGKRIAAYKEVECFTKQGGIAIVDRGIIGDMTFARMQYEKNNFTDEEWSVYQSIVKQEINNEPDTIIYLDCQPEVAINRIKKRGIQSESTGYEIEYIKALQSSYAKSFIDISHVIKMEYNEDIFIDDNNILGKNHVISILDQILNSIIFTNI